jgi:hypothetical protein
MTQVDVAPVQLLHWNCHSALHEHGLKLYSFDCFQGYCNLAIEGQRRRAFAVLWGHALVALRCTVDQLADFQPA